MKLFPAFRVKWTEPEAFQSLRVESLKSEIVQSFRWKSLTLYSLIAALAFAVFIGCMNRFVFGENPLGLGSYFLGFGSFYWIIFYAQPWLLQLLPAGSVALYTDRITRTVEGSTHYLEHFK